MKDIYLHDFTDQEHEDIRQAAIADGRSIHSWCKMALRAQSKGTKTVKSTITQGQELITQQRDGKGRFVNKGGK